MKTPREVLFSKHKGIEPRLDGLRQEFLRGLKLPAQIAPQQQPNVGSSVWDWREILLFARWHLTGLAVIWLLVVILRISDGMAETRPSVHAKAAPSLPLILTVIENRRQILEFSNGAAIVPPQIPGGPQRRSRGPSGWAYV
jgi:hypothetical protein